MSSIFSRIVSGEIPAYKVAENDKYLAFLDINPLAKGHTLVIPKHETDYYFELEAEQMAEINVFAQNVAKAIESVVVCKRIGVAVIGLEVPHAHIHLIPINNIEDINFARPKLKFSPGEFEAVANKINQAYLLQ